MFQNLKMKDYVYFRFLCMVFLFPLFVKNISDSLKLVNLVQNSYIMKRKF